MSFAALNVDLTAKIAKFEDSMNNATRSVDKLNAKSGALAAGFKAAFSTVAVGGLIAIAKSGIDAADALGKLSARTGVSVKDLAALQLSADSADTSLEDVGKAMLRLKVSVGDAATGNKALGESLARLGVTAQDPMEQLYQLADAVKQGGGSALVASDLNKVLGKSYANLLPLLQQGGDALRDSAKASESFADAMARLSPNAEKFNDQLDVLRQNAATAAAAGLIPLVEALNRVYERYEKIARLGASGASIIEIITGGVSADTGASLRRVNSDVADLEKTIARLRKNSGGKDQSIVPLEAELARLKSVRAELQEMEAERIMAIKGGGKATTSSFTTPSIKTTKTKTGGSKSDPLASLLGQTDIGKTQEYNRLLGMLNTRFDGGKKNAELYRQALAQLNEQFGRASIDVFDSGSFKTTSKEVAEFIKAQQDAINSLNSEMAQEGVAAAEAFESALRALVSDTTIMKTEELHKQVAILDKALFDGSISADIHAEALSKLTDGVPEKLEETKSMAEELGLSFTSAFEDAVAGGKSFSDVLKALEQDLIKLAMRKAVTEPLMEAVNGIDFGAMFSGLTANAKGGVYSSPSLSAYSGSIVNSPTLFKFASGAGLMGEAGAEAILPLKRGANGRLGVEGGGGSSVQVNVINNANGTQARTQERQENGVKIIDVMVEQVEGAIGRRMSRGEGLAPTMERRYGLNPSAGAMR